MPALARVIENKRTAKSKIVSLVHATAVNEQAARIKAQNAALRENGYLKAVPLGQDFDVNVSVRKSKEIAQFGVRPTFEVTTVINSEE